MVNDSTRILHLSDLHFGASIREEMSAVLLRTAKRFAPHFIVASGDLANHPRPTQFRAAREFLDSLQKEAGCRPESVLVVAGNHDYKISGLFGLRRLSRVPFHVHFRSPDPGDSRLARLGRYAALAANSVMPWGRELHDPPLVHSDPDHDVAFVMINSTPLSDVLSLAQGRVTATDLASLGGLADRADWARASVRIAVVHHHPLPIPFVRTDSKGRIEESFLILQGAGTLLTQLARAGVSMVLHGHKHFSNFARVEYRGPSGEPVLVSVLGAGSATLNGVDDPMGNEVNLIEIREDGTICVDQLFFSEGVERDRRRHTALSWEELSDKLRADARRRHGFRVSTVDKRVEITDLGVSRVTERLARCQAETPEGVWGIRIERIAPSPSYVRNVALSDGNVVLTKIDVEDHNLRHKTATITLGQVQRPSDGRFDVAFRYDLVNGHVLNHQEFLRRYTGRGVDCEYASLLCDHEADELFLTVNFPADVLNQGVTHWDASAYFAAFDSDGGEDTKEHLDETKRCNGRLARRGDALVLHVTRPVPGLLYRIRWSYNPLHVPSGLHRIRQAQVDLALSRLIAEAGLEGGEPVGLRTAAEAFLKGFVESIEKELPPLDPREKITAQLSVFDEAALRLRTVATSEGHSISPAAWRPATGEGCAGFAFEKSRIVVYDRRIKDPVGYYIEADEYDSDPRPSRTRREVLVAIPWVVDDKVPIGVLNLSSSSPASRLTRLVGAGPAQEHLAKTLVDWTSMLGEGILSAARQL